MNELEAMEILEEVKELDDSMYQFNPKYMEALDEAIKALEREEMVLKALEELINKPCTNQNMMAQNLAYRNVREMIKKQLGEVKECDR